jgi:hypothetical protein
MSLEFWTTLTPIAHKEYICDLCGGKIAVGEKYERFSGKNDGEMFDIKHHLLCAEIIRQYCDYIDDQEYDADSAYEWVQETVCAGCEHYDDERDDYTPCTCSIAQCPKIIERFPIKED